MQVNINKHFIFLMVIAAVAMLQSCERGRVFDSRKPVPGHHWEDNFRPEFEVDINDTTAAFDIFITVRHTISYPFTNLWIKVQTTYPSGKKGEVRHQLILGDNQHEKWTGDCMGDICDANLLFVPGMQFPEKGMYTFRISPDMRSSPIPGIMDIGIRIEKEE